MTDRDDNGSGADDRKLPEGAWNKLDAKVAEVTLLEKKLAEIDELEKKIAHLKELEYELEDECAQEEQSRQLQDTAADSQRLEPFHIRRPPIKTPAQKSDQEPDPDRGYILREYRRVMYQFSFIGIEFGVAVALGFFGGRWLDNRWDTAPWMMLLGVFLGLVAAGRDLYRLVKKAQKKSDEGVKAGKQPDAASSRESPAQRVGEDLVSSREETSGRSGEKTGQSS